MTIDVVAPAAPTKLTATGSAPSSNPPTVSLTWRDNSDNETGFTIQRATNSGFTNGLTTITVGANVTTYTDTAVLANTMYYYRVQAFNDIDSSAYSNVDNVTTALVVPAAPTIGTAAAGNAQATVSFTAPASDGGSAITSYTVTSSPGGITATGTSSLIMVTGLTNGTAYTFTLTATNAIGTGPASGPSNSVTPTAPAPPSTVPGKPTIGTAAAGNAQATVSFTAPASNGGRVITSYTVTSSPGGKTATGLASPITVTGLTNGITYIFTVTATNTVGTSPASNPSNSVTPAAPATVPGAPMIGIAAAGIAQATVSFTTPVSNGGSAITSYTVTSSPGGKTATGASSPITVTRLTNGTAYTFTVTATNAIGTGPASAPSNSVTPTNVAPAAPSKLVATASALSLNPPTVSLTWVDNSNNEAGFRIQRATNTGFTAGLTTFTVGTNVKTYTDTTVLTKTKYYYRVLAFNAIGNSAYSNVVNLTTAGQLPAAPSNLATGTVTGTSIALTWTDNATNETGFVIQRATNATFKTGLVSATVKTPNLTTYTRTGLARNRTYYFRVAAKNAAGNSVYSNVVSAKTLP